MENVNWEEIIAFIKETISIVRSKLDSEAIKHAEFYLNHDEYEMAFEGLFISIMELTEVPEIDFDKSEKIAILLNLNNESVYDFYFWPKFKMFVDNNKL